MRELGAVRKEHVLIYDINPRALGSHIHTPTAVLRQTHSGITTQAPGHTAVATYATPFHLAAVIRGDTSYQ